jgi:hypothetical protein
MVSGLLILILNGVSLTTFAMITIGIISSSKWDSLFFAKKINLYV